MRLVVVFENSRMVVRPDVSIIGAPKGMPRPTAKKTRFVSLFTEAYTRTSRRVNLQLLVSQGAFESGWGENWRATEIFNFFGRKGRGPGGSRLAGAVEHLNGRYQKLPSEPWAIYRNVSEALEDQQAYYLRLAPELERARSLREAFAMLKARGYATEPDYVNRACGIAKSAGYDPEAIIPVIGRFT